MRPTRSSRSPATLGRSADQDSDLQIFMQTKIFIGQTDGCRFLFVLLGKYPRLAFVCCLGMAFKRCDAMCSEKAGNGRW